MKKTSKTPIDIESEFVGKPVGPRQKKEKKPDLTDEIRKFLAEPVTLDSIKNILARMTGVTSKCTISIYEIGDGHSLIKIKEGKRPYHRIIYLGPFVMYSLCYFSKEAMDCSRLRGDLAHAIRCWIAKNKDMVISLE